MNLMGLDWGEKRIGLAFGDDIGIATPLPAATQTSEKGRLAYILSLIESRKIEAVVIGYPLNMDGSVGFKAREVDAFIEKLSRRVPLPIHRVDERLTSQVAAEGLKASGKTQRREDRKSGVLDSRAAALILQDYLEANLPSLQEDPEPPDYAF